MPESYGNLFMLSCSLASFRAVICFATYARSLLQRDHHTSIMQALRTSPTATAVQGVPDCAGRLSLWEAQPTATPGAILSKVSLPFRMAPRQNSGQLQ